MKKLLIAATVLSGFLAWGGAASAADVEVMDTAYDWSGAYIGVTAGYAWGDHKMYDDGGSSDTHSIEGFVGGGTLGFNWHWDSIVFGAEADVSFSDIDGSFDSDSNWGCGSGNGCKTDIDWFGTGRLRLGLPIDSLMPFVTGGVAIGGVDSEIEGASEFNLSTTEVGWTEGGGLEAGVGDSLTVKGEVLYVDLGRAKDKGSNVDFSVKTEFLVARVGLNWRF